MFSIDSRLLSTSVELGNWPLSQVLFKNEKNYPWLMLIPRQTNIQEIYQLSVEDRLLLTEEINALSLLMVNYFKPQKINVGALGNIVAQLHIHVVGRNKHDPLWPHSIWQSSFIPTPYSTMEWETLVAELTAWVNSVEFA